MLEREKVCFLEMERNGTYACRVTRVNNEETDYLGTLTVDEEYTIRIEIKEVERKCFDKIKDAPYKAVGFCNFPKSTLNGLQSSFDTRNYLRKSIFKVTDFGNDIGKAIASFCDIQSECMLACEAYKQILLDEEIKISTYNKFLKVMQVVEGFQRAKIDAGENLEFQQKKNSILEKLNDEEDKAFLEKYTNYNGQSFRKCMNGLTVNSLQVISG